MTKSRNLVEAIPGGKKPGSEFDPTDAEIALARKKSAEENFLDLAKKSEELPSAKYTEEEEKREWMKRARQELDLAAAKGEIDPSNKKEVNEFLIGFIERLMADKQREAGAAKIKATMELPDSTPEPTPEEIAIATTPPRHLTAKNLNAEEEAEKAAKIARDRELRAIRSAPKLDVPKIHSRGPKTKTITIPKTGEEVTTDLPEVDVDDAELRRIGFSPAWKIEASIHISKETGKPIYGHYFTFKKGVNGRITRTPLKDEQNIGLSNLKSSEYGALYMIKTLRADPHYTVRVWLGKGGFVGSAYRLEQTKNKAIFQYKLGSGTVEQAQKLAEKDAEAHGVAGIQKSPEQFGPRVSDIERAPSVPLTSKESNVQDEWEDLPKEANFYVLANEEDPRSRPVAWGDFWLNQTPEEITNSKFNPNDIDLNMLQDNRLSKEQKKALQNHIAKRRKNSQQSFVDIRDQRTPPFKTKSLHAGGLTGRDTEQKRIDSDGSVTGKPGAIYKEIVYGWENPPYESVIPPEVDKHRVQIQLAVPFLKVYLKTLDKFAETTIKSIVGNTTGWHKKFDAKGEEQFELISGQGSTDKSGRTTFKAGDVVGEGDVDPNTPCGAKDMHPDSPTFGKKICGHAAKYHDGFDKGAAFECLHPDCQIEIKTKSGGIEKDSRCQRFIPTDSKTPYRKKEKNRNKFDLKTVDGIADMLARLPSRWNSSKSDDYSEQSMPPYSPTDLEKNLLKALSEGEFEGAFKMIENVTAWFDEDPPEPKFGAIKNNANKPPYSKDEIESAKELSPEKFKVLNDTRKAAGKKELPSFDEMLKANNDWYDKMKNKLENKMTVVQGMNVITNYVAQAQKNFWSFFRTNMIEKWRKEMFGPSLGDQKIDTLQTKFITDQVFGAPTGVSGDPSNKKVMYAPGASYSDAGRAAFASAKTSELPFSQRIKDLEDKEKIDLIKPGTMSKYDANALKSIRMMQARRNDMTPKAMEKRFKQMLQMYEKLSEELKNFDALGNSIISFLRYLSHKLAHSGGRNKGADAETIERNGNQVRQRGSEESDEERYYRAEPKDPIHRSKDEVEALRYAERPFDQSDAEYLDKRREAARARAFQGSPKKRGEEREIPPTEKIKIFRAIDNKEQGGMKELQKWLDDLRSDENSDEVPNNGLNFGEMPGRDGGRNDEQLARFTHYLVEINEFSSANKAPMWYEDI